MWRVLEQKHSKRYNNPNELIITKVLKMTAYHTKCPNCGWKNSLEVEGYYCPKCGKDLKIMTIE